MSSHADDRRAVREAARAAFARYHTILLQLQLDPQRPPQSPQEPGYFQAGPVTRECERVLWEIEGQIGQRYEAKLRQLGFVLGDPIPTDHPQAEAANQAYCEYEDEWEELQAALADFHPLR